MFPVHEKTFTIYSYPLATDSVLKKEGIVVALLIVGALGSLSLSCTGIASLVQHQAIVQSSLFVSSVILLPLTLFCLGKRVKKLYAHYENRRAFTARFKSFRAIYLLPLSKEKPLQIIHYKVCERDEIGILSSLEKTLTWFQNRKDLIDYCKTKWPDHSLPDEELQLLETQDVVSLIQKEHPTFNTREDFSKLIAYSMLPSAMQCYTINPLNDKGS